VTAASVFLKQLFYSPRRLRSKKNAGTHRMADIVEAYDAAERRFSADGRITRDFLRD
jgi:hypothetical protein